MYALFNHISVQTAHTANAQEPHTAVATELGRAGLVQKRSSAFLITNQNSLAFMDLSQSLTT